MKFTVQPTGLEEGNVTVVAAEGREHGADLAADVRAGLTAAPKRLSCRYFYDPVGSELFEEICRLPEYYLTRAEGAILEERAEEIADLFGGKVALVELGSGSAVKTRLLMEVLIRRHGPLLYIPVDISRTALLESSASLARDFDDLEILAVAGDYGDGLEYLSRKSGDSRLILWLGSNIGNFERAEAADFLQTVRRTMSPDDRLLVGIDLRKDASILEPAYDDAQGVTAGFNKNILARINRELAGDFDLDRFDHRARYDEELGRIEMYLVSRCAQTVAIRGLDLEVPFGAGEAVHTENSYKYSSEEITSLAERSGMLLERQWLDEGQRFSVNILAPGSAVIDPLPHVSSAPSRMPS